MSIPFSLASFFAKGEAFNRPDGVETTGLDFVIVGAIGVGAFSVGVSGKDATVVPCEIVWSN